MSKFLDEQGLSHLWSKIKLAINDAASSAQGTTYNAGTGLSLDPSTNTFSLASVSGLSTGSYGPSANVTGSDGTTVSIPYITVDEYGRVTSISNKTYTSKNTEYTGTSGINVDSTNKTIGFKLNPNGQSYSGTVLTIDPQIVSPNDFVLVRIPVATATQLGVVKIDLYNASTNPTGTLSVNSNGLLTVSTDGLASLLYGEGDGITIDSNYDISVKPKENGGISVTSDGVALNVGSGTLGANKFNVLLDSGIPKVGIGNATTSAAGLMTSAQVTALNGKANSSDVYTKTETYTKSEVDSAIANSGHLSVESANSLDAISSPQANIIYIIPSVTASSLTRTLDATRYFNNGSHDTDATPSKDTFQVSTTAVSVPPGQSITDAELTVGGSGSELGYPIYVLSSVTDDTLPTKYGTLPYTNISSSTQTVYLGVDIDCAFPANDIGGLQIDDMTVTYNIGYGTSTNVDTKAEFIRINNNTAWEKLGTTDRLTIDKITNSEIDTICI